MARRWTPQHFVAMRRLRVILCVTALVLSSTITFAVTTRKAVALNVNGKTSTVITYAQTVGRLLQEQNITVKSHDIVTTTSNGELTNNTVVTVRSAYQTTITINGKTVPFWTIATSADQLLGFFEQNEADAAKITVNIDNVYNKLTGGLVINANGPVTVIADGKSSVAPDGSLPAASILDSKGIVLNKDDRVSVEKDGGQTILRVQRVTHGQVTKTVSVPFGTQTIIDPSLKPGEVVIRQEGENGERQEVYDVTYVDGVQESEQLVSQTTTKIAIDRVIAVGPDVSESPSTSSGSNGDSGSGNGGGQGSASGSQSGSNDGSSGSTGNSGNTGGNGEDNSGDADTGNGGNTGDSGNTGGNGGSDSGNTGGNTGGSDNGSSGSGGGNTGGNTGGDTGDTGGSDGSGAILWRPTIAEAKTYGAGAAAQYGWTGQNWTDLEQLWTRESNWRWNAENQGSGAYGIPQSLPGSKMAAYGADWRNDAGIQIAWGLNYISQRYGSPEKAWQFFLKNNWY